MITPDPEKIVRPRLSWYGTDKTVYTFNGVRVERHGKRIHLLDRDWDATTADGVGRVLIELAEVAAAEPDPALLWELKEALLASDGVLDVVDADRAARAILDGFDVKKRRTS